MLIDIKIEKLDGNIKEGKIGKISKKVGDSVKTGDKILQVELKKGNTAVKSKVEGVIKEITVVEGAKIKVGDIIAKIEKAE